jgi:hypothetical protein
MLSSGNYYNEIATLKNDVHTNSSHTIQNILRAHYKDE